MEPGPAPYRRGQWRFRPPLGSSSPSKPRGSAASMKLAELYKSYDSAWRATHCRRGCMWWCEFWPWSTNRHRVGARACMCRQFDLTNKWRSIHHLNQEANIPWSHWCCNLWLRMKWDRNDEVHLSRLWIRSCLGSHVGKGGPIGCRTCGSAEEVKRRWWGRKHAGGSLKAGAGGISSVNVDCSPLIDVQEGHKYGPTGRGNGRIMRSLRG